ncbi:AP2/ERF and B3 domain-containing transcription factor [Canna indica]|uniref:AP2/ERF and B3 domain-containing transcription factor n=1 Tax=Canna indica TaxID=4628 RepID=A0AAQ3L9C6_9LILI|nr:AP2/ERF and B3 domain-containing transcription factor [Canna indica]
MKRRVHREESESCPAWAHKALPWRPALLQVPGDAQNRGAPNDQERCRVLVQRSTSNSCSTPLIKKAMAAAAAAAVTTSPPRFGLVPAGRSNNVTFMEMFIKQLTPSDVGKLNRLVIPKKYAMQYFPQVASDAAEVLVEFLDKEARRWTFRYCYWKSSQSYVFTKGWNKFVKEKKLQAKDAVAFYRCQENDGLKRTYCLINIIRCNDSASSSVIEPRLSLKRKREGRDEEAELSLETPPEKGLKLFGVRII